MTYFAYGSNMLTERLQARVSSACPISWAILSDYGLRFHKKSTDGSGKCVIIRNSGETVHGVLFEMDEADRGKLDKAEGLGHGYHHQTVEVQMPDGSAVSASAYSASPSHIEPSLKPFDWYHEFVLAGALQHSLPADYIERLQMIETQPDQDLQRAARVEALRVLGVASGGVAG